MKESTRLTFTVTNAVVLLTDGTDLIRLHTDRPGSFNDGQKLVIEFRAIKDTGVKYVRDNFGIEAYVIMDRYGG